MATANRAVPEGVQRTLLYHYGRLRVPGVRLSPEAFERHLSRTLGLYGARLAKEGKDAAWGVFLDNLHVADWFLCSACLERDRRAWEVLFSLRASRADRLLVDALRARASRLFPRNPERQESAVADYWGYLLAGERSGALPILARYDGQRPLVPWLIRIFQNKQISDLRRQKGQQPLPDEELDDRDLPLPGEEDDRWHDEFRQAARDWFGTLRDNELLILGLRLRYRMNQRQVSTILGVHEGNVTRQTQKMRDRCLDEIGHRLVELGWTGDDLSGFILREMDSLLLDEPRLAADHLAALLAARGKHLPEANDD